MTENLYRKWRPRSFAELAGQEHVSTTLTNALETDRVAHAYLFAGPRGTGKTSTGRLLAKALNCRNRQAGEPCNQCESCLDFGSGRAMDLIELDAASNRGIEEIRSLRDKVAFAPGAGDFKVYLIDEVHMLTDAAFNALLKTLEEPPPHVVFILATTDAHKVPPTIASRCQRFDFRRIPLRDAVQTLERIAKAEDIDYEDGVLEVIARSSTGSLRDSINLLDQLATSYSRHLTLEAVRAGLGLIGDERPASFARHALSGNLAPGLALLSDVNDDGVDLRQFQRELVDELRSLLLIKSGLEPREGTTAEQLGDMRPVAAATPTETILRALHAFGEADLKSDPNSTLPLDIALAESILGSSSQAADPTQVAKAGAESAQQASPSSQVPEAAKAPLPRSASSSVKDASAPVAEVPPPASPPSHQPAAKTGTAESGPAYEAEAPTLASAQAAMQNIYDSTRAVNIQAAALLNSVCDILEIDDGSITLGFRFDAHMAKASTPETLAVFRDAVAAVFGRPLDVLCRHDPSVESWRQRNTASRNPLVKAAQEMGARVVSSDLTEDQQ